MCPDNWLRASKRTSLLPLKDLDRPRTYNEDEWPISLWIHSGPVSQDLQTTSGAKQTGGHASELLLGRPIMAPGGRGWNKRLCITCNRPVAVFLCHDKEREILSRGYGSFAVLIDCANKLPFTVDRSNVRHKEPNVCGSQGQCTGSTIDVPLNLFTRH
jgi:hypothetical protein